MDQSTLVKADTLGAITATKGIIPYDNTMLKSFQSCPRMFYWRHERSLVARKPALPLVYGIAIHAGMDAYYSSGGSLEAAVERFAKSFIEAQVEPDDKRNLENGARLLTAYVGKYPLANEKWKVLHVEKLFEICIDPERKIHYFGRMDMVIEWPPYGVLAVDHKTASSITDNYLRTVHTDRQFGGYIVGVQQYYDKVYGLMVNALEVTKVQSREPNVTRELTTRSAMDMANWIVETNELVTQIEGCRTRKAWPMNAPYWCQSYFRMCDYYPLCTQKRHPESAHVPDEDFMLSPWEPVVSEND